MAYLFPMKAERYPLKRRIGIVAFALLFVAIAYGAMWLLSLAGSLELHSHVVDVVFGRREGDCIYGLTEIINYATEASGAVRATALDLLFPLVYGLCLMASFRLLQLALPRSMAYLPPLDFPLFMVPLLLAMFADWSENLLLLYMLPAVRVSGDAFEPLASTQVLPYLTFIKTAALTMVLASLVVTCTRVLLWGETNVVAAKE